MAKCANGNHEFEPAKEGAGGYCKNCGATYCRSCWNTKTWCNQCGKKL